MLKMQIVMDNEKITRDKVYKADKIQREIDSLLMSEYGFVRSEGGFFAGSGSSEDYTNFWSAILLLKDEEWFLNNIKTWLWFNSDDSDDPEDFAVEDLLEHYTANAKGLFMENSALGSNWNDVEKELFTSEEIAESNLRVALVGDLIKARKEQGIRKTWGIE